MTREQVRDGIRQAFASTGYLDLPDLTEQDHQEMASMDWWYFGWPTKDAHRRDVIRTLSMVEYDSVDRPLPIALVTMLDDFEPALEDKERSDDFLFDFQNLLNLLDVPGEVTQEWTDKLIEAKGLEWVNHLNRNDDKLRQSREQRMAFANRDQAEAIYQWLCFIEPWLDRWKWDSPSRMHHWSACNYWWERAFGTDDASGPQSDKPENEV